MPRYSYLSLLHMCGYGVAKVNVIRNTYDYQPLSVSCRERHKSCFLKLYLNHVADEGIILNFHIPNQHIYILVILDM